MTLKQHTISTKEVFIDCISVGFAELLYKAKRRYGDDEQTPTK